VWRRFKQPTWAGLAGAISALLIAASLSGCGSLPRPFQPEHKASPQAVAGQLGSRAGVLIRAVPGLESAVSSDLAAKIATALHQREILAVTEGANRASYSLEGRLQDTERRTVAWQLVDATGRAQLAFETAAPNGTEYTTLIAEVADRVAAYLLPPVARADQPDRVVVALRGQQPTVRRESDDFDNARVSFECADQRVLMSGYLGSIGFGLPAAMGAWAATQEEGPFKGRPVVSISGDGGLGQIGRAHV